MKQPIEVPQVGESVTSGILAGWSVEEGAYVNEGDDLFELETDKATLPVPSPASGTVHITVHSDEEVEIGQVVGEIDTEGTAGGDDSSGVPQRADADQGAPPQAGSGESDMPLSPAARRVVSEHGLDPAAITGTGKGGRVTKEDAMRAANEQSAGQQEVVGGADSRGRADQEARAAQFGAGEQRAGSASSAASSSSQGTAGNAPETVPSAQEQATGQGEPPQQERKKMTTLRRRIAENLVRSKQQSAHLTTFNEVDMGAVMELRNRYKESFEKKHGVRLGFMSFFVKAAQRALQEFPDVNAYLEVPEIIYNHFYNIGVAISTDAGLIVPVLKNVDRLTFAEIESKIVDFGTRAQSKRIMPDEFTGGTFTISNGGVFGSMLSTPIPNPPQTAVMGMHSIEKRPVVRDDQVVIRPMMYLALTYDHRIIDGKQAIQFLTMIKDAIEDPARLMLDV